MKADDQVPVCMEHLHLLIYDYIRADVLLIKHVDEQTCQLCCPEPELVSIFTGATHAPPGLPPFLMMPSAVSLQLSCHIYRFLSGKGFYLLLHLAKGIQLLIAVADSQAPPMLHHFSCLVVNDLQLHCCTDFCQGTSFLIFQAKQHITYAAWNSVSASMSLCAALDHDQLQR